MKRSGPTGSPLLPRGLGSLARRWQASRTRVSVVAFTTGLISESQIRGMNANVDMVLATNEIVTSISGSIRYLAVIVLEESPSRSP
ncbi:hypothetical protein N7476_004864 [Penicillium atrosanguineum]|uniref:Uncharacterized protein n=1 Tax=Penicillium atrosanguineum TaxID=1132637 RepID=A0A9W9U4Y0_9EURO|nr:hypothetical protein N7476_004864 [Penicillium atrosanguineum]